MINACDAAVESYCMWRHLSVFVKITILSCDTILYSCDALFKAPKSFLFLLQRFYLNDVKSMVSSGPF